MTVRLFWKIAALGWQDSLVYRFNAMMWALYAIAPSLALMLVWLAAYGEGGAQTFGPFDLSGMITYYLFVTLLSVAITPHPEWDIASAIRDGKITSFVVRPLSYFGYRVAWESSYQIVKTVMVLPAMGILWWAFRAYIELPPWDWTRAALFTLAVFNAYVLLLQTKFLLGIVAFWVLEPGGILEMWNLLNGLLAGRLLPVELLPGWARAVGDLLPFTVLYAFPMEILQDRATTESLQWGFARQYFWMIALTLLVRLAWRRGLLAYEAAGG